MISVETQQVVGEVYRHALQRLAGVAEVDAQQMPLPVLHGVYGRLLMQPMRSAFYWSAILSRPDLFEAGIMGSTLIHAAQSVYRQQLAHLLPETAPWPRQFSWALASPVADIGLEPDHISLLGQMATVYLPHIGLETYYKTGWRAQLLLELVCRMAIGRGGPRRFRSPEAGERYGQLLELLQDPALYAATCNWIELQGSLLAEVSHLASFPQVSPAHAITALKQSRGYRPRELWQLNEQVMKR